MLTNKQVHAERAVGPLDQLTWVIPIADSGLEDAEQLSPSPEARCTAAAYVLHGYKYPWSKGENPFLPKMHKREVVKEPELAGPVMATYDFITALWSEATVHDLPVSIELLGVEHESSPQLNTVRLNKALEIPIWDGTTALASIVAKTIEASLRVDGKELFTPETGPLKQRHVRAIDGGTLTVDALNARVSYLRLERSSMALPTTAEYS